MHVADKVHVGQVQQHDHVSLVCLWEALTSLVTFNLISQIIFRC
jgi:hypothetical protein